MSKEPPKKVESTGEWRARTGVHNPIDTGQLRALDGSPGVEEPEEALEGADPYNQTIPNLQENPTEKRKRRSLDDMRRLSEMIKAGRSQK